MGQNHMPPSPDLPVVRHSLCNLFNAHSRPGSELARSGLLTERRARDVPRYLGEGGCSPI